MDSAVRAGKVVVAGHIIYYRIALVIKIDVLDVAVFAFLMEIPDQSRPLLPEDRKFDNRPVSRGPGLAPILALDEIDVCPGVHAAVDVTVEAAYKLLAVIVGELIVAGLLLPRLDDRGDRLEIRPIDTILAGLEERPADPVVAGVEQKKALLLIINDLRVSHYALVDIFKGGDVIRLHAAVADARALVGPSGNENPDVAVLVDLDGRVVVRIADTVAPLVVHDHGLREHPRFVVIAANHAKEVILSGVRSATIDKERLVSLLRVDRHRNMLHRVRAQSSGILVAIV